jgi:hypothetical protein
MEVSEFKAGETDKKVKLWPKEGNNKREQPPA